MFTLLKVAFSILFYNNFVVQRAIDIFGVLSRRLLAMVFSYIVQDLKILF